MAKSRIELILENKTLKTAVANALKALTTEAVDAPQNKAIRILDDAMTNSSQNPTS